MHPFLKHLKEDHEKQKELGKKLIEAADPAARDRLRKDFHAALYPHMIGEEASIFDRLKTAAAEEVRDDALEALQEHHVGKVVLGELMEMATDSDIFKAKAKVLDELNRHHIEEEEADIFQHLRDLCTDDELSQLFEKYEAAEDGA